MPAVKTVEREEDQSYEGQIDADARSAYAEVMGRIKSASADEGDAPVEAATDKPSRETVRDDGRDERGRFASKDKPAEAEDQADAERPDAEAEEELAGEQKPAENASAAAAAKPVTDGPPPSFSVATKSSWATLPEHVRADIVKRETEMGQGLKALQEYRDLKPYADLAQRNGTTIPRALDHFVRMESVLRQNLPQGLAQIAENFGYDRQRAAQLFADMAAKLGGGVPGQPGQQQPASDPLREALAPVLGPLEQRLAQLQGTITSQQQAQEQRRVQEMDSALTQFANDPANTYYANVEGDMALLMETGKVPRTGSFAADLKAAYELALRMNPDIQQALIEQRLAASREAERKKEQEAVNRAKTASRSLTGSKMPGTVTKDRTAASGSYDDELEADVRRAFRQHTQA